MSLTAHYRGWTHSEIFGYISLFPFRRRWRFCLLSTSIKAIRLSFLFTAFVISCCSWTTFCRGHCCSCNIPTRVDVCSWSACGEVGRERGVYAGSVNVVVVHRRLRWSISGVEVAGPLRLESYGESGSSSRSDRVTCKSCLCVRPSFGR